MCMHHGRCLREVGGVRVDEGWRTAEVGDGVCNAHPLAKRHDANFALEEIDVELEKHVTSYFLLWGKDVLVINREFQL